VQLPFARLAFENCQARACEKLATGAVSAAEFAGRKLGKAHKMDRVGWCLEKFVYGFSHVLWSHGDAGDGMNLHPLRVIRVLNVGSHDADVRAYGW